MRLFRTIFPLLACIAMAMPCHMKAQVISSLNEQNTKIAEPQKETPKKQTQFAPKGEQKVHIDTTTVYYAYLDSAQNCINKKDWSNAEDFIRKSIKSEPGNPNNSLLISNLATIQRYQGKLEESIKNYTLAIDMTPNAITLLNNRASVYIEADQIDKAIDDYKRILVIEPDNEEARYNIGMLQLEKNDFKEADHQFEEILRYHPGSILSSEGKAFLYKAAGNYAKAVSHFSEVIKAKPSVSLLANRADCYLMLKKLNEAADDIHSAIQITPDDGFLYILRAKLKKMRYENDEAQKDIQLAIDHGVDPTLAKQLLK
ncbi:MAG: tetratricopeptide repeat protein [Bacteroidales bacterium]|nr:tetratricopeptide repeat protein [Bacteroidales bacterium]